MQGKLFTEDFLQTGITATAAWQRLDPARFSTFGNRLRDLFAPLAGVAQLNEAATESELIIPILEALGWAAWLPQQTASGQRRDVPDILLLADPAAKQRALAERREERRYRHGLLIVEAKRWQRALDRSDASDPLDPAVPSNQILRYLSRVELASERALLWGILTNGRHWRLYFQGARSRSEDFLELDLAVLAGLSGVTADGDSPESRDPTHFLMVFYLLFGRDGFLPQPDDAQGRTFQQLALADSRHWEERVSQALGEAVFQERFPQLVAALAAHDPAAPHPYTATYLEQVRRAALLLLYRLLFVLYAEDRNLLPVHDRRYDDYSLRRLRTEVARRVDDADVFSASAGRYYSALQDLFRGIGQGDASLGLPPYNGGLFDNRDCPLLARVVLPDTVTAALLDGLSRREGTAGRRWINYRDLSVQQLGSIYERLLEYSVVSDATGNVTLQPMVFARRGSGSYYTHDALVQLLIRETVGPLLAERVAAFQQQSTTLARSRLTVAERLRQLQALDPAERFLELKICDPAMGSGHFLVSLVDYLADQVLEQLADSPTRVNWASVEAPYQSPLAQRISVLRERILEAALANGWVVDTAQLDDRHIVRRMILKRVIHGVDKNPMAVELAKLALWLHTFTVGAPLSFLDHHLRAGDALYGERLGKLLEEWREFGALFQQHELTRIEVAAASMNQLADLTDVDIAEVHQSQALFQQIDAELTPLRQLLDFWQARRWLSGPTVERGLAHLLSGRFGDALEVVAAGQVTTGTADAVAVKELQTLLAQTRALAAQEGFLHWEIAFPTVWRQAGGRATGGFDAVIGNPPWDRVKLQEVEWFAARRPAIAHAVRADDRKRLIGQLKAGNDPLWQDYRQAAQQAETAARIARESGDYPLLSGGDVNLYALFVERALGLVQPQGIVGLLTPSGIASDKGASAFFQQIATGGRLAALLDFENRKVFFPDVHASFKFCAFVFGGEQRSFPATRCAFFLHTVAELDDPDRAFTLSAADFAAVNPNTGTAPIFRRRRDAEITRAIYRRCPVLVDRRVKPPRAVWPVRYLRMFDMTNDSGLFKRADELEKLGFYPVAGNEWRKGQERYVPLYEGKMVQAYDHRAASVVVNLKNLHRPAQPEPADLAQHRDGQWLPTPQFWISMTAITEKQQIPWALCFKEISAPTNARTMIAALAPGFGFGNKLPLLLPADGNFKHYSNWAPLLLANLNSFALDFVARQKLHGQTLNLFIVEQLPLISADQFTISVGQQTIADVIREQVLHLSYTAVDLRPFAEDLGYTGEPFRWDDEDRRHRLAKLDALFFHLYDLDRDEADYILAQFPIIRAQDEQQYGRYLTRDLILAYMNAVAAGDLEVRIALR